jgi:hypothetical protein
VPQGAAHFKSKSLVGCNLAKADGETPPGPPFRKTKKKGGVATALSRFVSAAADQAMMLATTPAPQKSAVCADVMLASITR